MMCRVGESKLLHWFFAMGTKRPTNADGENFIRGSGLVIGLLVSILIVLVVLIPDPAGIMATVPFLDIFLGLLFGMSCRLILESRSATNSRLWIGPIVASFLIAAGLLLWHGAIQ